jgi:hypothetical protein
MKKLILLSILLFTIQGFSQSISKTCYITSGASNNATNCKSTPGSSTYIDGTNTSGTIYYLRLYNLATVPVCASATGFVETIPLLATSSHIRVYEKSFSKGIGFCLTGGGASTDDTVAATGVYVSIGVK